MTASEPAAPDRPDPTSGPVPDAAPPPPAPSPPSPPARPGPGWTEIGVAVVAYLAVSLLLAVAALAVLARPGPAAALVLVAISGVAALAAAGSAVAVRVRSRAAFGVRATTVRWLLLGLGAGVLAWGVARGVVLGWVALTGDTANPQAALLPAIGGSLPVLLALLVLGAVAVPVGEEILFRGVLTTALGRYGAVVAVLGSALVFGFAHGPNVVGLAVLPLGVLNAVMLRRSGSVWPGVVAHATNNTLVFVLGALLT